MVLAWMLAVSVFGQAAEVDVSEASRPYRLLVRLVHEPSPAFPKASMRDFVHDLAATAKQFVGDCWDLEIELQSSGGFVPDESPKDATSHDKIIEVHFQNLPGGSSATITAREYDRWARDWGPVKTIHWPWQRNLARNVFELCVDVFRPTASIVDKQRETARIAVRGLALVPSTSDIELLTNGEPLAILRTIDASEDPPTPVPWSFLVFRSGAQQSRLRSDVDVVSVFRDPLTRRSRQKIQITAMACRVGDEPSTVIEFRNRDDGLPIIGYEVAGRAIDQKGVVSLGSTNYTGSIRVRQGQLGGRRRRAAIVCEMYLMSGDAVLARFPIVPGQHRKLLAETSIDPLLTQFSGRILAFQEGLVDEAARRKLLELRLKQAADKSDLERMTKLADAINDLPDRKSVLERLDGIETEIQSEADKLDKKVGANLRRQILQTKALVERAVPQEKVLIKVTEEPASSGE